jgi:hypothetical protein
VDGQTKHYAYYTNTITILIKKYSTKFYYNNVEIHNSFFFFYPQTIFFMWIYFNMKQLSVVGDSLSLYILTISFLFILHFGYLWLIFFS